jgi:uncharacterized membrane protein YhaH (DUF805 family)
MEWYRLVWQRFAEFDGRSRRKEYWMFQLINLLIALVFCACIFAAFFAVRGSAVGIALGIFYCLYGLAAIIPSLAVTVRRLHDIGRTGWWLLISFIPFGGFVLLVFYCLDGTPGPNEYGPDPKNWPPYGAQVVTIG